jgi:hypothetical protein
VGKPHPGRAPFEVGPSPAALQRAPAAHRRETADLQSPVARPVPVAGRGERRSLTGPPSDSDPRQQLRASLVLHHIRRGARMSGPSPVPARREPA